MNISDLTHFDWLLIYINFFYSKFYLADSS